MKSRLYRPSNGTEGMSFEEDFCMQCLHTNPDPCKKPQCEIWCRVLMFNTNEKEYPKEWCYNEEDKPVCTAWVKWDWGNDGDPNDPDNPKAPKPDDPNQLVMPFMIEEVPLKIKKQLEHNQ